MGYTRKWVPPTIPLRNDLAAWKALFQDVHDSLLTAGLVQTATAGQLVIGDVAELPADGTFAGFCEYGFDDDLQATAPVIIKLEYGCGTEGLGSSSTTIRRNRTPRIRCTVSFKGNPSTSFQYPQAYGAKGSVGSQLTDYGMSFLSHDKDKGFLGFVYGAGSRNKPMANPSGGYHGATLTLFVQRSTLADGTPTDEGVAIYSPSLPSIGTSNLWEAGILPPAISQYVAEDGEGTASTSLAVRLGGTQLATVDGAMQAQEVFYAAPDLRPFPWIFTYVTEGVPPGGEFAVEVFPGSTHNFVALGNETGIGVDALIGQRGAIAMLFE